MKRISLLLLFLAFIAQYGCKSGKKDAHDKTDSVDVKSMIQEAYDSIRQDHGLTSDSAEPPPGNTEIVPDSLAGKDVKRQ